MERGIQISGERRGATNMDECSPGEPFSPKFGPPGSGTRDILVHTGNGCRPVGEVVMKDGEPELVEGEFPGNLEAAAQELEMAPDQLIALIKEQSVITLDPHKFCIA